MKIGSIVAWSSQAGGFWREKQGKIVAVIPAGSSAFSESRPFNDTHRLRLGGGSGRKGESYLVEVPALGKGKSSLYWPLTSKFTEVPEGD